MNPDEPKSLNESLWEFPCDYDLKVMGAAEHPMQEIVVDIVSRHVENFDHSKVKSRPSRTGKYVSITASFVFTNKEQVEAVYAELDARSEVAWKL